MLRLVACVLFALLLTASGLKAQEAANDERASIANGRDREVQQSICLLLESAAHANGLPVEFFVRLIWQESRFQPAAIGPPTRRGKHALGIAQFMPATAAERNLLDPLNPIEALPKAAEFLKELRARFGNLGLAAAAYNAGPGRVRAWMSGGASMPAQTRAYVLAVTGNSVDEWAKGRDDVGAKTDSGVSCETLMAKLKQPPTTFFAALQQHVVTGAIQPWGAILGAHRSRSEILDRYATLQKRFATVLAGREPILLERGGSLPRYQVRVGADSRATADDICKRIHLAGGDCVVLRNPRS
jgi:hypothetical protein